MSYVIVLLVGILIGHAFAEEIDDWVAKHK